MLISTYPTWGMSRFFHSHVTHFSHRLIVPTPNFCWSLISSTYLHKYIAMTSTNIHMYMKKYELIMYTYKVQILAVAFYQIDKILQCPII